MAEVMAEFAKKSYFQLQISKYSSKSVRYIFIFDINGDLIDDSNDKTKIGKNFKFIKGALKEGVVKS